MSTFGARPALVLAILAAVAIGSVALALPVAEPFRHAMVPRLPMYVIVLAIFSTVAQLVSGLVDLLSRSIERRIIVLRLSLALSALFLALAFSSLGFGKRPLLMPLVASAILAVAAATIARRARLSANP